MNKLIEFNVPGGTVVVESHDAAAMGGVVRGAGSGQLVEKFGGSLEDTISVIRPVANAALAACKDLLPGTVEVSFSLKFDAHVGAIIARAGTEGTLNIKLTWKPT